MQADASSRSPGFRCGDEGGRASERREVRQAGQASEERGETPGVSYMYLMYGTNTETCQARL